MKIIISFIIFFFYSHVSLAQESLSEEIPASKIIPIDYITNVEIYNSWANKRWTLWQNGLNQLKTILTKSKATKTLLLKPGHLYMYITFSNANTLKDYDFYMSPNGIFLDPDYLSKKPVYSISIKDTVDWDRIK